MFNNNRYSRIKVKWSVKYNETQWMFRYRSISSFLSGKESC